MRSILSAAALLLLATQASFAQSGCPAIIQGATLTAGQWNACFGAKQDALGFPPLNKSGDTMTGRLNLAPSASGGAGVNVGQGAAPTTPQNGDFWATSAGFFGRANGTTVGPFGTGGGGGGGVTTFAGRSGVVAPQVGDYTAALVGLGSVTNDAQAKATIWPNTAMSGDCLLSGGSVITCTKTSGTPFAASATTDTTNATNLATGNVPAGRNTSVSSSTVLGNFSGGSAAASAQSVPSCANDGTHALTNNGGTGFNCAAVSAAGFHVLTAVRLATTGALSNSPTYSNGASGVGATLTAGSNGALTIDSVAVATSDRVLIKDQATTLQNGVYTVTNAGAVGAAYVLTRATDADQPVEISTSYTFISAGTANGSSGWVSSSVTTVGTDPVTYSQFSANSGVSSFNGRNGVVTPQTGDYTATNVGLGNVTNDVQTKAAVVPNTAPSAGQILAGNGGGTAYAPVSVAGDCTMASTGSITCTKTSGVGFATSATTDTTNASNIASGNLAAARNTSIATSNVLGNFSGGSTAASAQAVPTCANDGSHALTNNSGTGFNCTVVAGAGGVTTGVVGNLGYYGSTTTISGAPAGSTTTINSKVKWTGDQAFGSRPWCDVRSQGAVGDGVTDDSAAFAACVTALTAMAGGTLYIPPGNGGARYCLFSGVTDAGTSIRFLGGGPVTDIDTCDHDATTITLNGNGSMIENLTVFGRGGRQSDTVWSGGVLTVTHPAVELDNAVGATIRHLAIFGGAPPLSIKNGCDCLIEDVVPTYGYGNANVRVLGTGANLAGAWLYRVKADQTSGSFGAYLCSGSPCAVGASSIPAWSSTHSYSTNDVVSLPTGFLLQASVGGTSGGSAPTIRAYNFSITDGGVTWKLLAPTTYYAMLFDSNSNQNFVEWADTVGPYTSSVYFANTLALGVPTLTTIQTSNFGATFGNIIDAGFGNGLSIVNSTIGNCFGSNCVGVYAHGSFTGDLRLTANKIFGGGFGIDIGSVSRVNASIMGNVFGGWNGAAFVTGATSYFNFIGNVCGSDPAYGGSNQQCYNVSGGDYYNVAFNLTNGEVTPSTPANGGGATNSTVTGNH